MISLILPTYHPDRVARANDLYDMLKKDAGVEVEVIVACDNPEVYDRLKSDFMVKIPKQVGFTRAVNIAEKFARFENVWWIDDYVIPEPGWGPKALKGFWEKFPDGRGIMELSSYETDCPKSISTRAYLYEKNNLNLLWPEYIHCGDTELWYRATAENRFYVYPETLWHRDKIFDACKVNSDKVRKWDVDIRLEREKLGWPSAFFPDLQARMERWATESGEPKNVQLYKNLYNL